MFKTGSPVVYRKTKFSKHPGPRACRINPSRYGDAYGYVVEKLWVVERVESEETIVVVTRRGKRKKIKQNDPNLRTASIIDRLRYRGRFPIIQT